MSPPRCTGTSTTTGKPCRAFPVRGATVCVTHGGAAPQVKAKALERLTEQAARKQLARLNVPPVEDPLTQLAAVTGQVLAWKDAWAGKVNALTDIRYETEHGEQLRAEIAVWERALDRCEKFLTAMARLDIDARLARITEARATAVITVFLTVIDTADPPLAPEQRDALIRAADAEFARQAGVMLSP